VPVLTFSMVQPRTVRRELLDEQRELRARLAGPRPDWCPAVEWARDRAATRERLDEITQELATL